MTENLGFQRLKRILSGLSILCHIPLIVLYSTVWCNMSIKAFLFKKDQTFNNSCATDPKKTTMLLNATYDNDDATCLRNRLKKWPVGKPKAFIYYLIHWNRASMFLESIRLLDKHFNNQYHYPVIVFHENMTLDKINSIRSSSKSDIYFHIVEFQIPDFLPRNVTQLSCHSRLGYRHMCRFHAKLIYELSIVRDFEYVWRLDDDSKILRPMKYDIFEYMRKRNLQYGYATVWMDSPRCTVNLWKMARTYVKNNSITPTFFSQWGENQMYYNNFEVSRLSLWLSDDYRKFIDYIDRSGGIYYYRWGDAPIKSIAVSLFVPRNETHRFKDIGYRHQGIGNP